MRSSRLLGRLAPWLVALALAGCAASRPAGDERADAVSTHKAVIDESASCQSCHAQSHPQVVTAWSEGPHGLNLVECFVCHGAREAHFMKKPDPGRCDGCHTRSVASVTAPDGVAQSCFGCHDPHRLTAPGKQNPHVLAQAKGALP